MSKLALAIKATFRQLIRMWRSSPYGKTLIVFAAAQVAFVLALFLARAVPAGHLSSVGFKQDLFFGHSSIFLQAVFFVVSLHGLLAINTVCYMWNMVKSLPMDVLQKSEDRDGLLLTGLLVTTILISGYSITTFYRELGLKMFGGGHVGVHEVHHYLELHEFSLLVIFCFFVISSLLYKRLCNRAIELLNGTDESHRAHKVIDSRNESEKFFWSCDLPGFLGVAGIFIASFAISTDHHESAIQDQLRFYKCGFALGALGLHVVFTQAILAFLSIPLGFMVESDSRSVVEHATVKLPVQLDGHPNGLKSPDH